MGTGTIWEWVGATLGAKRGCPGITHNMELLYRTRIWVSWFWIFGPLPYLTEGTSLQVISPYVVQKSSDRLAGCVGHLPDVLRPPKADIVHLTDITDCHLQFHGFFLRTRGATRDLDMLLVNHPRYSKFTTHIRSRNHLHGLGGPMHATHPWN